MRREQIQSGFLLVGNQLWLDFINTEIVAEGHRSSLIRDADDLKAWLWEAGATDASVIETVTDSWNALEKETFLRQALALRTELRAMAERITAGQAVSDQTIVTINFWLERRRGTPVLRRAEDGYTLTMRYEASADGLLAPIAASAAELLAQGDLQLVRKCENPQCILYFYDTSKNHARRWCRMEACGNRQKVAAHYRRSRQKR